MVEDNDGEDYDIGDFAKLFVLNEHSLNYCLRRSRSATTIEQ